MGLYPFNPSIVLNRLLKKRTQCVPLPPYNIDSILPLALTDITAIQKLFNVQTSKALREGKQLRVMVQDIAVTNILQQREIIGLKDALIGKKIKKRRGKALFNKLRTVEEGKLLWLSLKKLQLAKDLKTKRKQVKLEEQHTKEKRKV